MKSKNPNPNPQSEDRILWRSSDDVVRVRVRRKTAMRSPQHSRPIVTLDVLPSDQTRVRRLPDGRVDICLEHVAQAAWLQALNDHDQSVQYGIPACVPQKPAHRKLYFDRLNAERHRRKRRP